MGYCWGCFPRTGSAIEIDKKTGSKVIQYRKRGEENNDGGGDLNVAGSLFKEAGSGVFSPPDPQHSTLGVALHRI